MSTTVTPIGDQVPTVTSWASMIAALDRGSTSTISAISGSANTDRLIFVSSASGSASSDETTPVQWVPDIAISLGEAFFLEFNLSISKSVTDGTNDDDLSIRIVVPSGVKLIGTLQTMSRTDAAVPSLKYHRSAFLSVSGGTYTQALGVDISNTSPQSLPVLLSCIAVADSGSGNIEVDYIKTTDSWNTEYTSGQSYVIGRRILG